MKRSKRKCKWRKLGSQLKAMRILLLLFLTMSVDMQSLTMTLLLLRIAKNPGSFSLLGNYYYYYIIKLFYFYLSLMMFKISNKCFDWLGRLTLQGWGPRWFMLAPKIDSRGSLMGSRWSSKQLTQQRWILMCLRVVPIETEIEIQIIVDFNSLWGYGYGMCSFWASWLWICFWFVFWKNVIFGDIRYFLTFFFWAFDSGR